MNTPLNISSHTKIAFGSVLAAVGGLLMALSPIVGWYSFPRPWDFLLGFATGLLAGAGAVMTIGGLVERRRERQKDASAKPS
jgi:putative Mn2+ efflux pump MntP